MGLTEINLREKKFHNELQSKPKARFEHIFYKAVQNMYDDFHVYLAEKTNDFT